MEDDPIPNQSRFHEALEKMITANHPDDEIANRYLLLVLGPETRNYIEEKPNLTSNNNLNTIQSIIRARNTSVIFLNQPQYAYMYLESQRLSTIRYSGIIVYGIDTILPLTDDPKKLKIVMLILTGIMNMKVDIEQVHFVLWDQSSSTDSQWIEKLKDYITYIW